MYLYLYDSFLIEPKYKKIINSIETKLIDLGISGRVVRLTILKNVNEIIKDHLKKGIQTVVVIGSEKLFKEAAISLVNTDVVLGFIPVIYSKIAEILNIPYNDLACEVISARRIEKIDMGKIDDYYFLTSIEIEDLTDLYLECDELYQIFPISIKSLKIINLDQLNFSSGSLLKSVSNPKDGLLEIVFFKKQKLIFPFLKKTEEKKDSLFYIKKALIKGKKTELTLSIDKEKNIKTPTLIEVVPSCLKIIVGKRKMYENQ
jgi:diacylglycerol kinase family enzyme